MKDNRFLILEQALNLVPFDGWSQYTLKAAAKRAGVDDAELGRIFPRGVDDCVAYFFEAADAVLKAALPEGELVQLRVPARIEKIILTRLSLWIPVREAVRRTVSYNTLPWNNLSALKTLYNTVDLMWYMAGDKSTDFNFYTKRMTLAAVYSTTLLFWLDDTSNNQEETAQFLKRRLGNVADFGKFKQKFWPPKVA